jgi:DNA-directed RNA polymerase III subunit RPC6
LDHVRSSGVTSGIDLQLEDMQNVINTLIYDGLIERVETMDDVKYKPKNIDQESTYNAYSDIPCSTCPVFSKCSEDSDINPKVCPYLQQWMKSDFDF